MAKSSEKPAEEVASEMSRRIAFYVVGRLKKETASERGAATAISEGSGVRKPTITNLVKGRDGGGRGLGLDVLLKLMAYWNLDLKELSRLAIEETAGDTFETHAETARAMARRGGIPEEPIASALARHKDEWNAHDTLWWFDQIYAEYKKQIRAMSEASPLGKGVRRPKPKRAQQQIEERPAKSRRGRKLAASDD